MTTPNTAAIESLRTFATAVYELEFAHLCTAALHGEEWAVERISAALQQHTSVDEGGTWTLSAIRTTDTTRPDGLIARSLTSI